MRARQINESTFKRGGNPHKKLEIGNYTKKVIKLFSKDELNYENPVDIIVTDPCYLFNNDTQDDIWQEFVKLMYDNDKDNLESSGIFTYGYPNEPEITFIYTGTAHGDGSYTLTYNGKNIADLGVDAGMLCVTTVKEAKEFYDGDLSALGDLVGIIKDFSGIISVNNGGNILGDLEVITDGSDNEEDEVRCSYCGEDEMWCNCNEDDNEDDY